MRKVRGEVVKMDPQLIVLKEEIRVENSNHRIEFEFMNVFRSNNPHDNEATVSWKSLKVQSI